MTSLAYFSHSYRWQQKGINHRVWELLGAWFHFAVDPPGSDRLAMDVPQLEAMMRQCSCFVAVVPRRVELTPKCSPYQLFENGLAIRARRRRLLFVDKRLDRGLFGPEPDDYITFDPDDEWSQAQLEEIADRVERFAKAVERDAPDDYAAGKPIGLLLPEQDAYSANKIIEDLVARERTLHWIRLSEVRSEYELIGHLQACSVVIAETRSSWVPADVLGILQSFCVPTIRLFQLQAEDSEETVSRAMNLSRRRDCSFEPTGGEVPVVFAGYRVGREMHPIAFWRDPQDVCKPIRDSLERILSDKKVLRDPQEATNYFLQLGRVPGRVFISNQRELNPFVRVLRKELLKRGVESFHYTDPDAIKGGHPDFPSALEKRVTGSAAFVALVTRAYNQSKWCRAELDAAIKRSQLGRLSVVPLLMEQDEGLPDVIKTFQAPQLYHEEDHLSPTSKVPRIIAESVVEQLEASRRLQLSDRERTWLHVVFGARPREDLDRLVERHLQSASVTDAEIQALFDSDDDVLPLETLLDRFLDLARRSFRAANALGRLILVLAYDEQYQPATITADSRKALAEIVHSYRLLPDVRVTIAKRRPYYETGIRRTSEDSTSGVFDAIQNGSRTGDRSVNEKMPESLYATLLRASATSDGWGAVVTQTGESLADATVVKECMWKVTERLSESKGLDIARSDIGLCLFGDESGLEIPFEWYRRQGSSQPLCLEHPVRRFLMGAAHGDRLAVRASLLHETPMPMRVLLVGVNAGGIRAEDEVEHIRERFRNCYEALGWPVAPPNITVLTTREVTEERLCNEIGDGSYDMLHLVAHGAYEDEKPGILIRPKADEAARFLPASRLAQAAAKSRLRFVYLACCQSGAAEAGRARGESRRFDNLIQAFVKDGAVPEVLGFLWPIVDRESHEFAEAFYERFLGDFRTAPAVLEARKQFYEDQRIWASPVLYSRCETEDV